MNLYLAAFILLVVTSINCQSNETNKTTSTSTSTSTSSTKTTTLTPVTTPTTVTTTTSKNIITTITPENSCSSPNRNYTCETCLTTNCYFCEEDSTCRPLKFDGIFPEGCKAAKSRWLNCSSKIENYYKIKLINFFSHFWPYILK
jgi:hypothetical protein